MKPGKSVILLVIGASLLFIGLANAQQMSQPMTNEKPMGQKMSHTMLKPMPDSLRMQRHIQMLQDSLGLTADQAGQIKTIMENEEKQMMADREKHSSDIKALQAARTETRNSTDKEIRNVLNKEQLTKYDRMQKEMQSAGKMHWKDHTKTETQK